MESTRWAKYWADLIEPFRCFISTELLFGIERTSGSTGAADFANCIQWPGQCLSLSILADGCDRVGRWQITSLRTAD